MPSATRLSALCLASCLTLPGAAAFAQALPDFDATAKAAIDAYDATGMTAAVMVDGETVYTGAYGVMRQGRKTPVTEDTLFPIASISKAFTTTALAILVDRGQVDWDAPLKTYIPEFEMSDPWVTEHFTLRDALTHRSGLPLGAGDLLIWPDGQANVEEVIAALPHLRPSTEFRSEYAYDNLLYIVAGEVVARVSGMSWSDFVTQEILEPVGMTECASDKTRIRKGQPVVTGHEREPGAEDGVPVPKELEFSMTWAATGGIFCTAPGMMKWAKFWLDDGVTADGTRLISEEQFKEVWTGVTPTGVGGALAKRGASHLSLYALGWSVMDFEGKLAVTHSGGAPGVVSRLILIPEEDIAIFASANDYRATASTFAWQVADDLINGRDEDSIAASKISFAESLVKARAQLDGAISPPADAQAPSLPLNAYTGVYSDPWYGEVEIRRQGKGLYIDMGQSNLLDGPLTPYNGDQFVAFWPNRSLKADAFVNFIVEDGEVSGLTMKAVSDITDFSYDFHDLDLEKVSD
ncbi:serine hydrolase [Parvularcula sp. LCG005]|uniref:serine hydrolase n=1 Tax=Parvularcula sp. LCG005 TaxID=3078805 RepID=UPI0029436F1C|nr:serine hydrolase [Parvularcula sp. LCG005]WOI54724.1 serine hydrolase [Parvularcula sp. LCG005]